MRIPVPSGVASIFAVIGGLVIVFAIVVIATDPSRAAASKGTKLAGRIVGALAALMGTITMVAWLVPDLRDLARPPGIGALLFALSAVALAFGRLRWAGAGVGALGAALLIIFPVVVYGQVYGALFMPAVIPLVLAIVIAARRSPRTADCVK